MTQTTDSLPFEFSSFGPVFSLVSSYGVFSRVGHAPHDGIRAVAPIAFIRFPGLAGTFRQAQPDLRPLSHFRISRWALAHGLWDNRTLARSG